MANHWKHVFIGLLALTVAALFAATGEMAAGQTGASAKAAREDGRQLFLTYCASCHGPNARGGGVVAGELRHVVPDLSQFAMRNGGTFPSVQVRRIIDGTGVPSHGTREMPVWGDAFKRIRGESEQSAKDRIDALTNFLETIQDRRG